MSEKKDNYGGDLTVQEKAILQLLMQGMNTSEISKFLPMSYHEAAELIKIIKRKLNVSEVSEIKNNSKSHD